MSNQDLTVAIILVFSVFGGVLYSLFLEHLYARYSPNLVWLAVLDGNGFIVVTLSIMEHQFGIPLTAVLVFYVNLAWGGPVIVWQLWQWRKRKIQEQEDDAATHQRRAANP